MNVLLKEHEWNEGHEDDGDDGGDESFRGKHWGQILYPTMARLRERFIFPRRSGNILLLKMLRQSFRRASKCVLCSLACPCPYPY